MSFVGSKHFFFRVKARSILKRKNTIDCYTFILDFFIESSENYFKNVNLHSKIEKNRSANIIFSSINKIETIWQTSLFWRTEINKTYWISDIFNVDNLFNSSKLNKQKLRKGRLLSTRHLLLNRDWEKVVFYLRGTYF